MISNIRKSARSLVRDQRGAAITEYLIIVGLVALFCFAAYKAFGEKVDAKIKEQTGKIEGIK